MIKGYNFRLQGKRHKKEGTVCQDYSIIHEITPTWKIVAVADGVSTRGHSYSEVASKIACETVCKAIEDAFPFDIVNFQFVEKDIEAVIKSAMHTAANAVEKYVQSHDEDYGKYDTTLVVALYNGDKVYMGMIGDSGIVLLLDNGELLLSTPMNDENGHVYPLRFRACYQTSSREGVAAVYCTTDGLFKDYFVVHGTLDKNRVDKFIPYKLFANAVTDEDGYLEKFKTDRIQFCENEQSLSDDISVSLLVNTDKCVFKSKKETIDYVTSVRAIVSVYQDEKIRKKAFVKQLQAHYPDFTDDECLAIYNGEVEYKDILAKYKKPEDETFDDDDDELAENSEVPADEDEKVSESKETEALADETPEEKETDPAQDAEDSESVPGDGSEKDAERDPETENNNADESDDVTEPAAEAAPTGDETGDTCQATETEVKEESPKEADANDDVIAEEDDEDEKDRMLFNIFKKKKRNK